MSGIIHQVTLRIPAHRLLLAIWYGDGSGAVGIGAGFDHGPESYTVVSATYDGGAEEVVIILERWA